MTPTVESYIRVNNIFVPITDFSGALPDKNYIEGAIVCSVNGQELFQLRHHDLIDQLWAYIVEGLHKLQDGKSYDVYFPDQPLRLRFACVPPRLVEVSIGSEVNKVDYRELRSTLKRGALDFYAKIKKLYPEALTTWEKYEKQAKKIED